MERRLEFVDGYLFQPKPLTSFKKSRIRENLIYQLGLLKSINSKINFEIYSKLDWKISNDTVVRSDIMIVCGGPKNEVLEFPAALIFENRFKQKLE